MGQFPEGFQGSLTISGGNFVNNSKDSQGKVAFNNNSNKGRIINIRNPVDATESPPPYSAATASGALTSSTPELPAATIAPSEPSSPVVRTDSKPAAADGPPEPWESAEKGSQLPQPPLDPGPRKDGLPSERRKAFDPIWPLAGFSVLLFIAVYIKYIS